ncbi:hypothetical protein EST62_05035 [Chlorobaculum sp. 24CR]|uniref:hypothetical protein n=1 Tax=Chlorobaculum sp. 24CR TaxID=2508878 RepID=UPI00100A7902|nr:hypothetical protein [Chlorobaculum sp. 24CR]RXK87880.1 hypothetical protein EST62_05035 [Chlorobaculum sp. 24CR]
MSDVFNTLVMFLIGLPVFVGMYVRYKSYGDHLYWQTFRVTIAIYFTIGVGYSFIHYSDPAPVVKSLGGYVGVLFFLCWVLYNYHKEKSFEYDGVWIMYLIGFFVGGLLLSGLLISYSMNGVAMAITVCSLFIVIGGLFSIAGPLISGFNLSAVIYSLFFNGGIDDVFFWKNIFDFLNIDTLIVRIMILLVSAFSGAVELVSYIHDNILDQ